MLNLKHKLQERKINVQSFRWPSHTKRLFSAFPSKVKRGWILSNTRLNKIVFVCSTLVQSTPSRPWTPTLWACWKSVVRFSSLNCTNIKWRHRSSADVTLQYSSSFTLETTWNKSGSLHKDTKWERKSVFPNWWLRKNLYNWPHRSTCRPLLQSHSICLPWVQEEFPTLNCCLHCQLHFRCDNFYNVLWESRFCRLSLKSYSCQYHRRSAVVSFCWRLRFFSNFFSIPPGTSRLCAWTVWSSSPLVSLRADKRVWPTSMRTQLTSCPEKDHSDFQVPVLCSNWTADSGWNNKSFTIFSLQTTYLTVLKDFQATFADMWQQCLDFVSNVVLVSTSFTQNLETKRSKLSNEAQINRLSGFPNSCPCWTITFHVSSRNVPQNILGWYRKASLID